MCGQKHSAHTERYDICMQILKDRAYENGFLVSKLNSSLVPAYDGSKLTFGKDAEPFWKFVQWFSTESLADAEPQINGNTTTYKNRVKSFERTLNDDGTATITLTCNAFEEYGGPLAKDDFYGWVHMGFEQHFEYVRLADLNSFVLSFKGKLDIEEKAPGECMDTRVGQVNICFILFNCNPDSLDCGKIIWNQVCLHDSRFDIPPEYCAIDAGVAECSGEFIYTMDARRMIDKPFANSGERFISYDWLPQMKEALAIVKSKGGMLNTEWEDLATGFLGIGFEISRGDIYKLSITNLSVEAN